MLKHIVGQLKSYGFRVFLAKRGTYGVYSDGKSVVYFQYDRLSDYVAFSGVYKSNSCGTGWQMQDHTSLSEENAVAMLNTKAPAWATQGNPVWYYTLEEYLTKHSFSDYSEA